MALSQPHLESLEQHVLVHEERLSQLREQLKNLGKEPDPNPKGDPNPKPPLPAKLRERRDLLEREIRFHEELIALARDPRALAALEDLAVNPDFARWVARDPRAVAQKLGIVLPVSLSVRLMDLEGQGSLCCSNAVRRPDERRVRLRLSSYDGLYPFTVTWDSETGFSPVRDPVAARKRA